MMGNQKVSLQGMHLEVILLTSDMGNVSSLYIS
jgi:hypothetical protein